MVPGRRFSWPKDTMGAERQPVSNIGVWRGPAPLLLFTLTLMLSASLKPEVVDAVGFGRCPTYPSMPKFNMSRVRIHSR